MESFIVWFTEPWDTELQGFECQAEDAEHALEQCRNAYPEADAIEAECVT